MPRPAPALRALFDQHAALRTMMDDCEQLADDIDRGRGDLGKLARAVARLRAAFVQHNQYERQVARPIVCERLAIDHRDEHRALTGGLDGPTAALRATLYLLRSDLAGEERYFRSHARWA